MIYQLLIDANLTATNVQHLDEAKTYALEHIDEGRVCRIEAISRPGDPSAVPVGVWQYDHGLKTWVDIDPNG